MTMIIVAMKGQQELMDLFIMFIILGEGKGPGLTMSFVQVTTLDAKSNLDICRAKPYLDFGNVEPSAKARYSLG